MDTDTKNFDHLQVLKAVRELPFNAGKTLLTDFLLGDDTNASIEKNRLSRLPSFGSLAYSKEEIGALIDSLIHNGMLEIKASRENKYWKLLHITEKGNKELAEPNGLKQAPKLELDLKKITKTVITPEDRALFEALEPFLRDYNEEQKKAIVCGNSHILCIAGAGSGKTTVLTKRIEFLARYRSVEPSKILAITFTRKARQEMAERLAKIGGLSEVRVETFNSFCEKLLQRHNDAVYSQDFRVISYSDKLRVLGMALSKLNFSVGDALDIYFTENQKRGKTPDQLIGIFVNDCYFIRDYFKSKAWEIANLFSEKKEHERSSSERLVYSVCNFIDNYMQKRGMRDYTDQLIDCIAMFKEHKELIPEFEHILIDEYQDVNSTQIELVELLTPKNIFAVGDPRQSIFGWRGSDIRYIISFQERYPGCEVIALSKNYRSNPGIVELSNSAISGMSLPDMESAREGKKDITLLNFDSEPLEQEFIVQKLQSSKVRREQIFVLARTNRQLSELSELLKKRGIAHIVRSDEINRTVMAKEGEVTLATIHAIKGLEAELVFVTGCTMQNFPCRGSEHPIIEMLKLEEYDKDEEERRLFYVALSRAKDSLYLTYSGKSHTGFITQEMGKMIGSMLPLGEGGAKAGKVMGSGSGKLTAKANDVLARLRDWRLERSRRDNCAEYMIMQNKTLEAIAERMPGSIDELEGIFGMGPLKLRKYGEELIDVVNS